MKPLFLDRVLCPACTHPGGLRITVEYISNTVPVISEGTMRLKVCRVPVMSCILPSCKMRLVGVIDGNDAVFPDPHAAGYGR